MDIDKKRQLQLCFNIFPRIKTALHIISEAKTMSVSDIQMLFQSAHEQTLFDSCIPCTMPFLEDGEGNTPLDISLDDAKPDINLGNLLLTNIARYPYLHSGPVLCSGVIQAFKYSVPALGDFLNHRLVKSPHLNCGSLRRKAI